MINSMTGFSQAEKNTNGLDVKVEIRSYNSRYLDIQLRIPQAFSSFEEPIKSMISEKISRGRIEFKLQLLETVEESCEYEINEAKAKAYFNAVVRLQTLLNLPGVISITNIISAGGIIKPVDTEKNLDQYLPIVRECVEEALLELNAMRKREGDCLAADFGNRLSYIDRCINEIESETNGLIPQYQARLRERISALTQGIVEIDMNRIVQEAAILADRSDISEEITRARIHMDQFRNMISSKEPAGRKINFLLQELTREFNTIGSKSGNAGVSYKVVEVKSELEKIREQVQNVE